MRQTLADIIKNVKGFKIVAQASNGREAIKLAIDLKPNIVLMDVSIPEMNGIDATRLIRKKLPAIRIIGLSMNSDSLTRMNMLNAGACEYLIKSDLSTNICDTIRNVHQRVTSSYLNEPSTC